MMVPDATPTFLVAMIHTPIASMIVVSHDIGRGNREIGQVWAALPFQDHERVGKLGLMEQSVQPIKREHPQSAPLGGEMLLTPTGDIVSHLIVGMKVFIRQRRVKRQAMHGLGLTIDERLGFLGLLMVRHAWG